MRTTRRHLPALLLALATPRLHAVDLAAVRPLLEEVRFERSGRPAGPGPQVFRFLPASHREANWPAELARREARQMRKVSRRYRSWAGMLGGFPAWGLDREVTRGPHRKRRVGKQLVLWAMAPGGFLMEVRADDPGGLGRRRAETRAAFLLRGFQSLARGTDRDPFRALREGEDGPRWTEFYRLRFPGSARVEITGPPPAAAREPPFPRPRSVWGYRFLHSDPASPERWFAGTVPGYRLEGRPDLPGASGLERLRLMLGVREGIELPTGHSAGPPSGPGSAEDFLTPDAEPAANDLLEDLDLLGDDLDL